MSVALAVANHPMIRAYDKALATLHARHTAAYGPNFMDVVKVDETEAHRKGRGITFWTEKEERIFHSLYRGAILKRAEIRAQFA